MKKILLLICVLSLAICNAQELNCTVSVEAPKNQVVDQKVFTDLENAVRNFMNGRKWSTDNFLPNEKFNCAIVIRITEIPAQGFYRATFLIQAQRPVFNSSYLSPILNYTDKSCDFEYLELSNLEYIDNGYFNNLSSLLSFYAFMILAFEYESFGPAGGDPYFKKALQVVNAMSQSEKAKFSGWDAFSGALFREVNLALI